MNLRSNKISAAEAKRTRQRILAEREKAKSGLPPEFLHWLHHEYVPAPALRRDWAQVSPLVEQALATSNVRGQDSLRKHTTHLGYFLQWALNQGHPAKVPALLVRRTVDEYTRVGMPGSSPKSRTDRRSRLRKIVEQIHPDQAPPPTVTIPRKAVRPPYSQQEMSLIMQAALVQPTAEKSRQLALCVGLGAGAGIDSADLKLLHRQHIHDAGEDGIRVDVQGERARQVWVRRDFEPLVRRGIDGLTDDQLLLGRVTTRHNVAAQVFSNAVLLGQIPKLEQSRLRSTWLTSLMSRPVPLALIAQAAGLISTRTLFDLLPYVTLGQTASDPATALRDGGAR